MRAVTWQGRRQVAVKDGHRLPLDAAPDAYAMSQEKRDNCLKVVLKPGRDS